MAKKEKVPTDEKFENQDFDLFKALEAIDKKDYEYYDRLTAEQQKKFVPFMMIQWVSAVKGSGDLQRYYLQSVEHHANKHFLNSVIQKDHGKLQWLMLCAASPGLGKQFHQWVPQLKEKVSTLKEVATVKDTKDYFKKIYSKVDEQTIDDLSEMFVATQKRKVYLAKQFSTLKFDEIELLSELITDDDIKQYERDSGN
jgi:hypothetical protein